MQDVKVDRNKYIGGSDIPVIMGISKFKTRYELLMEKANLRQDEFEGNEYTEYGNIMEPKIRQFVSEYKDTNFVEDKLVKDDIRCHVDGYDGTTILEIKTTSVIYDNVKDYQVYLVQLLFYMMNYGVEYGLLAVYERPRDFSDEFNMLRLSMYDIKINDYKELCDKINQEVEKFRQDLEKIKNNNLMTEEELVVEEVVELSKKVLQLENQLQEYEITKKEYDNFKEKLRLAMIKNNVKKWETPQGIKITLVEDKPDEKIIVTDFDEDLFIKENLDLHQKYHLKLAEYKVEKEQVKKGRKGFVKISK